MGEDLKQEVLEVKDLGEDVINTKDSQESESTILDNEYPMEDYGQKEQSQPSQPKLSYEDLHTIAVQATQQAEMFQKELQKYQQETVYMRLEFLFKVLETGKYFTTPFINRCSSEIEKMLTIPGQE